MGYEVFRLVRQVETAIVFVDLLAEFIEVFLFDFDSGGASVATATDDGILGEVKGVGEIKITKATARTFINTVFHLGEHKGWLVIGLEETPCDNTDDAFVLFASLDNHGVVANASLFDFASGRILFIFTFFVQLF